MKKIFLTFGFAAMMLAAAGCAQTESTDSTSTKSSDSGNNAGKKVMEEVCAGCHSLDEVTGHKDDKAGWTTVVQQMKGFGANISPEDEKKIVEYLAESQPKE